MKTNNNNSSSVMGMGDTTKGKGSTKGTTDVRPSGSIPSIAENDSFLKRFRLVEKIGEGSYSEVLKCKNRESGQLVAAKRLKHIYKSWNHVNDIAEVTTLRTLARHPNILQMLEIHYDAKQGKVSLVFEIMDMNLYELIKDRKKLLAEKTVRLFMFQLLKALKHLHKYGVFHRDIKPENILVRVNSNVLKLGDLGSVRGIFSQPPFTEYISTRWYRSPECLLTSGQYGFKMDIWAAGCVFYEIMTLQPLFPGSSEIDQINRIHNIMGPPPAKTLQKFAKFADSDKDSYRSKNQQSRWDSMLKVINDFWKNPKYADGSKSKNHDWFFGGKDKGGLEKKLPSYISAPARDLIKLMLTYDPDLRPTSQRILNHPYFNDVRDFKVPENELSKSPIIAVCGDEYGRTLISHYYGQIDLKTLGDKKQKHRVKMNFAQMQNKQRDTAATESLTTKKSSPLLRGAKSPETPPDLERALSTIEVKKPTVPIRTASYVAEKPITKANASIDESPPKKTLRMDQSVTVTSVGAQSLPRGKGLEKGDAKSVVDKKASKVSIIDTYIAASRQKPELSSTTTPVPLTSDGDSFANMVGQLCKKKDVVDAPSSVVPQPKPTPLKEPSIQQQGLQSKIINFKITSEELQKINEARQIVNMDPIKDKQETSRALETTTRRQQSNRVRTKDIKHDPDNPYIKVPTELSPAGRKKHLLQILKQQQKEKSAQQKQPLFDRTTIHVPPQVAAAALKFQNQAAKAAQKARAALSEFESNTSNYLKGNSRSSINVDINDNKRSNEAAFAFSKTNFGLKKIDMAPEDKLTSAQHRLQKLLDHLESGNKEERTRRQESFTMKTPLLSSALKKQGGMGTTSDISKTLDLDKQNRISLRQKLPEKENKKTTLILKAPQVPSKRLLGEKAKQSPSRDFRAVEPGSSATLGIGKERVKRVQPQSEQSSTKLNAGAKNDRLGYVLGRDWNNNAVGTKPPIPPPKFVGPTVDRSSIIENTETTNISREVRIAQILENAAAQRETVHRQSSPLQRKTFGTVVDHSAADSYRRRTERIRSQLREEVYCSSDDDVVSSMRHKLDILISERARRASDASNDSIPFGEDDGTFDRTKNHRPRKILRKESEKKNIFK